MNKQENKQKISIDDFEIKEAISKGSFGTVYKVSRKKDGKIFALKQVKLEGISRAEREEAIDEARVLSRLTHPYVIKHHHSFLDTENKLNILMEFAAGGTIFSYLKKLGAHKPLPEELAWKFFIQALLGLKHVHDQKIIHRDIKTLNLFLDSNENVKIGDFGIARVLGMNTDLCRTIVGTPFYISPELCEDKPYNEKTDIWALGVVLYECVMRRYPFEAQNEGALVRKILKGHFAPVQNCSNQLSGIIMQCLEFNPIKRPNAKNLLDKSLVKRKAVELGIDLECKQIVQEEYNNQIDEQTQQQNDQFQQQLQHNQQNQNDDNVYQNQQKRGNEIAVQADFENLDLDHPFALKPPKNPIPKAKADNINHLFDNQKIPKTHSQIFRKPRPENMPPAGVQIQYDQHHRPGTSPGVQRAPYSVHIPMGEKSVGEGVVEIGDGVMNYMCRWDAREHEEQMWTAKYQTPAYARKRCPELMATGPVMRIPNGTSRGSASRAYGVVYQGSESSSTNNMGTTKYVGSTYQRSSPY